MSQTGRFEWQMLGKPDYATAASFIASLPSSIRNEFRRRDEGILRKIFYLSWVHAFRSGRGAAYCWPSQTYLAKAASCSTRTVRRAIVRLVSLGLLQSKRRAPRDLKYLPNLYSAGKRLLASLFARFSQKVQQIRPRTKVSDKNLKKVIEGQNTDATSLLLTSMGLNSKTKKQAPTDVEPDRLAIERKNERIMKEFAELMERSNERKAANNGV